MRSLLRKSVMLAMRKTDFTGTGHVFGFTLRQHMKSRATKVLLVILAVMAVAAVPVLSLIFGDSGAQSSNIGTLYIKNDTAYAVTAQDLARENEAYAGLDVRLTDADIEDIRSTLSDTDALLTISLYKDLAAYQITAYPGAQGTALDEKELNVLTGAAAAAFRASQLAAAGAPGEAAEQLSGGFSATVSNWKDYVNPNDFGSHYAVTYIYAMLVIFLCIFSSSYIIRAVIEEKSSMLVELLMISVRPLALILGKILAMVVAVFASLVGVFILFIASYFVTGIFMDVSFIANYVNQWGLAGNLDFPVIAIVLFSLLIAYLFFALIGGLLGTGCSSQEEAGSATTGVMMLVMVGYFYGIIAPAFGSHALMLFGVLFPVLSAFCAPVAYVLGDISFWMLCLSWLIQLAALGAVALLTSRVYAALLMHRGRRIGVRQIFTLARAPKGGARA